MWCHLKPLYAIYFQLSCEPGVVFLPYVIDANQTCVVVDSAAPRTAANVCIHPDNGPSLYNKVKKVFNDVDEDNVWVS